ncbi:kinesin-like protein KIN-14J [Phoenix dactylifera]|uniref:Kinesin-like protein KIN-14J n=1 Tax=Phoenix dactylifera TaxID=42345 RepID=A0A8B8ZX61_PHODC|nr:kinesin-like protein KIN-14J [Phoenix dactylifera]
MRKDDDCLIASPILKGISVLDLSSTLQLLGSKYSLMKRHHEQSDKLVKLRANYEMLKYKFLEECEPKYETLKQKYSEECAERKRLHNELIKLKGNMRVFFADAGH